MKLSNQAIAAHNGKREFCSNDGWNKQHKAGTYIERVVCSAVARYTGHERITRQDVRDFATWGALGGDGRGHDCMVRHGITAD